MENRNNGLYKILVVLGAVAMVALLIYISKDSQHGQNNGKRKVKVGVISILTGQFAALGENYVKGIELAKDDFEKAHTDVQVDLQVEDDGFDAKKGISAFRKLTDADRVDALLNVSSPTIDVIHGDVVAKNLPVVQFGIQSDGLAKDPIFQISPMAADAILQFGSYLKKNTNFKKVAIVYENGKPFDQFYDAFLKSYGSEDTQSMRIMNKSDIDSYATEIVHGGFDGVAILGMPESGALLIKKIHTLTSKTPTYMIDAQFQTGTEDYKRILGDLNIMNGTYSVWLASSQDSKFKDEFAKKYGQAPGSFADSGYDAFMALMNAYNPDHTTWIQNIQSIQFDGATGKVSFDENGVRVQNFDIMKVENGAISKIDSIVLVK